MDEKIPATAGQGDGNGSEVRELATLARWPAWHIWRGVIPCWYARRLMSSPPVIVRAPDLPGLDAAILDAAILDEDVDQPAGPAPSSDEGAS
jgi:hypothetical protein